MSGVTRTRRSHALGGCLGLQDVEFLVKRKLLHEGASQVVVVVHDQDGA